MASAASGLAEDSGLAAAASGPSPAVVVGSVLGSVFGSFFGSVAGVINAGLCSSVHSAVSARHVASRRYPSLACKLGNSLCKCRTRSDFGAFVSVNVAATRTTPHGSERSAAMDSSGR